jgi:translation initiation factor 1 (eIF-1/SUI1)
LRDHDLRRFLNGFAQLLEIEAAPTDKPKRVGTLKLSDAPLITLTAERVSCKKATIIAGIEQLLIDNDTFLQYLRTKLATSGTVHQAKTGPEMVIMVQGKQLTPLKSILVDEIGLPEKQVKLIDKIGDTKKKNKIRSYFQQLNPHS